MKPKFRAAALCTLAIVSGSTAMAQRVDTTTALRWSQANRGVGLLVYLDGQLTFESYGTGLDKDTPYAISSGTKAFAACAAAVALRDGLITSLDELVADTVTEWKTDSRKSKITYRSLLSMSSGLEPGVDFVVPSYAAAIRAQTTAVTGQRFQYGPNPYQVFGEALRRKLLPQNKTVAAFINEKILQPTGIRVSAWIGAASGQPQLSSGMAMTGREWAEFGEFMRKRGRVGSRQIIPERFLEECLRPSKTNPAYLLGFWAGQPGQGGPNDMFYAGGVGGQRVYVSRELGLVMVRFGANVQRLDDEAMLDALLPAWTGPNGAGCMGTAGVATLKGVGGRPTVGSTSYAIELSKAPAQALGVYLLGFSRFSAAGLPLPLDFTSQGMTGCSFRNSAEISSPFFTSTSGVHVAPSPFPNVRLLGGKYIYVQALILDSAANALGLTLSDSIVVRVGTR